MINGTPYTYTTVSGDSGQYTLRGLPAGTQALIQIPALMVFGTPDADTLALLMGAAWTKWEQQTSYWPQLGGFAKAGAVPWIGGLVLWLVATWAHIPAIMMPAGVWRWLL